MYVWTRLCQCKIKTRTKQNLKKEEEKLKLTEARKKGFIKLHNMDLLLHVSTGVYFLLLNNTRVVSVLNTLVVGLIY